MTITMKLAIFGIAQSALWGGLGYSFIAALVRDYKAQKVQAK